MYPFATTNEQDFYNLMSVYLDATLRPLLRENDFAQEGWRIGPANPTAIAAGQASAEDIQLVFKGVVYNEMKGQMSDASYLYQILFQRHIIPTINDSGGDPTKMTDLTYEQLKEFHHHHYHPSNAKILTYGNLPLEKHLEVLNARLQEFGKITADKDIKVPITLNDGPRTVAVEGPVDPLVDPSMQYKTSTTWLAGDTADILQTFSLNIVASLLMDGYGSPLYRNLIEAGLGHDWSPNTGFDTSGKMGVFSIGLTGVKEANVPEVKKAINRTLQEVYEKGFDKSKVDGLLHQLELALRHKTAQFGLGVMQRLQPAWFNGVNPFDVLAWNKTISGFKKRFAEERYLENLLKRYFLNDKTMTFTMRPSTEYEKSLAIEESSRLARKIEDVVKASGGEEQAHQQLEHRELELLKVQEAAGDEDLSCLPTLRVADIPRKKEAKPIRDGAVGNVRLQWRETATNGLTYFRAVNILPSLPEELRMYIPLFTDAVMRVGTKDKSMEQLEDLIKLKTGGLAVAYHSSTSPLDVKRVSEGLIFAGYALDRNVGIMYELLRTLVHETHFDGPEAEAKIRELLQAAANGAVDGIAEAGSAYAQRYAEAGVTAQGRLNEETAGLTQVRLLARLASEASSKGLGEVIAKLKTIQRHALECSENLRVAITCGSESVAANEKELRKFLDHLPSSAGTGSDHGMAQSSSTYARKTLIPLPYQVHYTGLAIPTVNYTDPSGSSLQVLAQLLTHKHLHHEIREKGGAYGGGAYARSLSGSFGFYSYRDPNPQNTLKIMNKAGVWARDKAWTARDLEEAKLSVFQALDAPESASEEGMIRFLRGVDENMLQARRERLLNVSPTDVQMAAEKYLVHVAERGHMAVLGPKPEWAKQDNGWTVADVVSKELDTPA